MRSASLSFLLPSPPAESQPRPCRHPHIGRRRPLPGITLSPIPCIALSLRPLSHPKFRRSQPPSAVLRSNTLLPTSIRRSAPASWPSRTSSIPSSTPATSPTAPNLIPPMTTASRLPFPMARTRSFAGGTPVSRACTLEASGAFSSHGSSPTAKWATRR